MQLRQPIWGDLLFKVWNKINAETSVYVTERSINIYHNQDMIYSNVFLPNREAVIEASRDAQKCN